MLELANNLPKAEVVRFDWRNPDYAPVYRERIERLRRIRSNPACLPALKQHYAAHPAAFIDDWAQTSDPRNRNRGLAVETPFVLFERQKQMLDFILARMRAREPGLIEKSRDCGASWLICCLAATLCLFNRNVVVGIGSSKEDRIDRSGDPDSLFWKIRFFLAHLPPEFRGAWDESRHSAHMRIAFPDSGSAIVGEAGDAIGRGGRSTLFLIDEAAHIERPALIEASLASNTECRIDVSTPAGLANAFAVKRRSGRIPVFTFAWRHDPRKDQAWYERQCELLDPVTRAAEIDLDYAASVEGIIIPAAWVAEAIGAHLKLGIEPTGAVRAGFDVADQGRDANAFAVMRGVLLIHLESWSGQGGDIYKSVERVFNLCERHSVKAGFYYDADGLGAGVRGDANQINEIRKRELGAGRSIEAYPFQGSGELNDPDGEMVPERLNKNFFGNLKAQCWWALRLRFMETHRALAGLPYDRAAIISIDPKLLELEALQFELSQPTYRLNGAGKVIVEKAPEGARSPNLADAVMIAASPVMDSAEIWKLLGAVP